MPKANDPATRVKPPQAAAAPAAPPPAKPAAAAPPPPAAPPAEEEVELDGQKLRLSPQAAEALRAYQAKTKLPDPSTAALEEIRRTLVDLRSPAAPPAPPVTASTVVSADIELPDDRLMTTDPAEYNRQLKAGLQKRDAAFRAEIEARDARARAETAVGQRAAALEGLRRGFYETYPDFKGTEVVTDGVLTRKWDELERSGRAARTTITEGYKEVAAEAAMSVMRFQQTARKFAPVTEPPHLEGAAPRKPAPPPAEAETKERRSGLDIIRELKAKHGSRRHERAAG